ncbi:MAG: TetR/AcrR family transcriptional regulator [Microbacterium sp.]|uniref:AcrR family transcriptional regulator n=1 Tax=Microbacterium natoriense TaxID=284570 RepID=A0AAW8ETC5_9MICO|nr:MULTISPECIES: TetR/AcrR family transcriptional regulator [Microbacterium]MBW8764346.1 TetR/AcrR family transcriptional regulator [Microbacterium sp.]MDQ0646695.1 AcrR family transcriptional regulator [Microbacterium natoriense]
MSNGAGSAPESSRVRPATRAKREQILKAAVEIFGNKGFANGTLADVAEQVGITHAGVLHHFGSKQKLLLEVLDYRDQADVQDLESKRIPYGPELFVHLVKTAFVNEKRPGIVQAYTVLSAESVTDDHPGRAYFEHRYTVLRKDVSDAFADLCAQEGVTEPATVAAASAAILAVMDGLQLQWLLHPDVVELAHASEFAIRAIVNAVLHPGPELASYVHDS